MDKSKIKFNASKTSSWHRCLGIRWWSFEKPKEKK
jgi:hypothetical protein